MIPAHERELVQATSRIADALHGYTRPNTIERIAAALERIAAALESTPEVVEVEFPGDEPGHPSIDADWPHGCTQ